MHVASSAFIFPGQGSQKMGMLADHATRYPIFLETIQEASRILGKDLWDLISQGPEAFLNRTENTQPVLLATSVGLWRAWQKEGGLVPRWLAGHSLGEYVALVCAHAMSFEDAIRLVRLRGQLMQEAVPEGVGAMAAVIGLNDDIIAQICEAVSGDEIISPANFNAIGQTVVAGHASLLERFTQEAKAKGAKRVLPLPVSVPSHCPLMKEASVALGEALNKIKIVPPMIPILHNVDADVCQNADDIRARLVAQLYSPVRWVETIQRLKREGVEAVVECGPQRVLLGLVKRIDDTLNTFGLDPVFDFESTLRELG